MSAVRRHEQRGSISAFVVVLLVSVMGFSGLVIDGARIVAGKVGAADHAENAARAGAQEISQIRAGVLVLDPAKAEAAAQSYLAAHGISGVATASPDQIVVTVTTTVTTTLLALVGISTKTITATRSSTPVSQ